MDILYILQHQVHCDVAEFELRDHQYSRCALMIGKMRSTSAIFPNASYNALLITCSRA
jgi:hypothetical protein